MVKSGLYRAEKVRHIDGVGCCVWRVSDDDRKDSAVSICFDFSWDDYEDMLKVIQDLKEDEEKVYVPDPEYEKFEVARKKKEATWWWKLHDAIEDIGIQIVPFDWRIRRFLITRPETMKNETLVYKSCKGFHFGPIVVTW